MADLKLHANNYSSTLNGAITNVQTTITVTSAAGLPSITGSQYYALTIDDGTNIEIVHVTDDTSSPTLTVTRGQEGTSGTAFADLTKVQLRVTADDVDRKQEDLDGAAVTQKVTPVAADKVLLQDSADSDNLKYSLFSAFGGGASNFVDLGDVTFTTTTSTNDTATFDAVRFITTDIPAAGIGGLTLTRESAAATTFIMGWRFNGSTTVPTITGSATTSRFSFDNIGYPEISYSAATVSVRTNGLYTSAGITGSGTAVYNFGNATSLEIPNSTGPVVNTAGEIAIDTSVTDFSAGLLKYYSNEEMGVVAMPIAEFTSPTDGHVVTYNATNDEFELAAAGGGGDITPAFAATATLQSVLTSTFTKVQFDTEVFDSDGDYDATTNYRFTPSVSGDYFVAATLSITGLPDTAAFGLAVYKNGVSVSYVQCCSSVSSQDNGVTVNAAINCNGTTDYIEIYCIHNSGVSKNTNAGLGSVFTSWRVN
jgi:hypothetical protein